MGFPEDLVNEIYSYVRKYKFETLVIQYYGFTKKIKENLTIWNKIYLPLKYYKMVENSKDYDIVMLGACIAGNLPLVRYSYKCHNNPISYIRRAREVAKINNHMHIVEYLYKMEAPPR